jgi:hypothetical protein
MKEISSGAELVARWRDMAGQDNPAGPLFTAGEFAESDIVNSDDIDTCSLACTGSRGCHFCP